MKRYDLIVIGSGPAGERAAIRASHFGHKVALIEKQSAYGGAGAQTGTLPSKTLKESAIFFSGIRDLGVYGMDRKLEQNASIKDFFFRKNHVSEIQSLEIEHALRSRNIELYQGNASFQSPHEIEINGAKPELIYGSHILIASGSYPHHPDGIPFDGEYVHDSDTILTLDRFPNSLVIVGAGVIGCEYATLFAVMGCKVTLINSQHHFLKFIDQETVAQLKDHMEDNGVQFILGHNVESVSVDSNKEVAVHAHLSEGKEIEAEMFLYAAGRNGNTKSLQLQNAGVQLGERETIVVNEDYQSNVSHIYAAGDVIGFPALASTSMDQGRVAVAKIFDIKSINQLDRLFPYGIYTIPEVSCVGLNEEECKAQGIDYGVGRAYVKDTVRAKIMAYTKGMLKLIYDKNTNAVLGVHIIAANATELVHFGMLLVEEKIRIYRVLSMVYNHPSLNELYKFAAYDAWFNDPPNEKII